jgi:hypothetical protein
MTPKRRWLAARKAKNATIMAAMSGNARRKNSGQEGRIMTIAANSGASRSKKLDRLIVIAS